MASVALLAGLAASITAIYDLGNIEQARGQNEFVGALAHPGWGLYMTVVGGVGIVIVALVAIFSRRKLREPLAEPGQMRRPLWTRKAATATTAAINEIQPSPLKPDTSTIPPIHGPIEPIAARTARPTPTFCVVLLSIPLPLRLGLTEARRDESEPYAGVRVLLTPNLGAA